ncbi:tRNA-dependent cyclodipeptide synthase [Candidatus Woesearchaeota archaeon]|nr:tRNA-dependent cyclodipeptide synthase [Candidatus Woesearchaeota archaeon]
MKTKEKLVKEQETLIIGISIENSYYNKENIETIITQTKDKYKTIKIMIPDKPMIHTYTGMGYTKQKAQKKARKKGNYLKNKIKEIIQNKNINNIEIINWETDIETKQEYKQNYKKIIRLYKTNKQFQQDINNTTKEVIQNKTKSDNYKKATPFILKEIAYITASQEINEEKTTYTYHKNWPIYENILQKKYGTIKETLPKFKIIN